MIILCQYKNHTVETIKGCYHYEDPDNGIPEGIKICHQCYLEHLNKYYPDSYVTQRLNEENQKEL